MTFFNMVGVFLISLGTYYCFDRKTDLSKEIPDIPPSIEVGNWRVEYYIEKDKSTIWRKIYKSGTQYNLDVYWRQGQGLIPVEQRIQDEFRFNEVKQ